MVKIYGVYPVLAPPFKEDGELDFISLDKLINYIIGTGANGITLFGIGGEYYKLSEEERKHLMKYVMERVSGKINCIVSITDHSYEVAVKFAKLAEKLGADALMLLPPFFLKPSLETVINHIKNICNSVQLPVMVQYAPNETGVVLPFELFMSLQKELPNFKYVKIECQPPGPMISSVLENTNLDVIIGYAGLQLLDGLERGVKGVIPGCSLTEVYVKIFKNYLEGDKDVAYMIYLDLVPLLNFIFQSVEMIIRCEKIILYRRGIIDSPYCRAESYQLDNYFNKQLNYYVQRIEKYFDKYKYNVNLLI